MADEHTAYSHRKATMLTSMELNWEKEDIDHNLPANQIWLTQFHDAMAEFTSHECYQNFIDHSQKDYLHAYYGKNLKRLVEVKNSVDPHNLFHFPQSIPVKL